MPQIPKDLTGLRVGKLTVISRAPCITRPNGWKCSAWNVRCDCGTEKVVRAAFLKNGQTRSCGCLVKEKLAQRTTHGLTHHPLYKTWDQMMRRCYDTKSVGYHNYGGRGIRVCDRWHDVRNYVRDVGERPEGMTADRINNDGDYTPSNFRWATKREQTMNRRPFSQWRNAPKQLG